MGMRQSLRLRGDDDSFSRRGLGLVVLGVVLALAVLLWAGKWRPDVPFLPAIAPAEWIIYPTVPDVNPHLKLELPVVFKHSVVLSVVPMHSLLRIAGLHRYTFLINGTAPGPMLQAGKNWKQPDI